MTERKAGQLLRAMREQATLTQEQVALCAGCSTSFVRRIENGEKFPGSSDLIRGLAHACGMDWRDLAIAFAHDKVAHWINKRPDHISPETAAKLAAILDREPVAA